MKRLFSSITILILLLYLPLANGYEIETHADVSRQATNISPLGKDSNLLENLGLEGSLTSGQLLFPDSEGKPSNVMELIRFGARNEDLETVSRALNHFYDPAYDRALTYFIVWGLKTPDWALENPDEFEVIADSSQHSPPMQCYSFSDANDYLFNAITSPEKSERERNFGLFFQTLGHLMHLIQDMAQPEHVRNDTHLTWNGNNENDFPLEDVSTYEIYTEERRRELPFTGYAPVELPHVIDFWHTDAFYGLADYTNRNFVSTDTNFDDDTYRLPIGTLGKSVDIKTLFAEVGESVPTIENTNETLKGKIDFIKNPALDFYAFDFPDNERAASLSIFDADLKKYNITTLCVEYSYDNEYCARERRVPERLATLNRFNFDAAHKFLIPRAVGYSAGFLNYFFRGKLEISPPDEGVYAIVDHATVNQINQGFTRVKLKLTNVTPNVAETPQYLWPGSKGNQLVAVAKYYRNPCYRPDLTGEYKEGTYRRWNGCTATDKQEYISISQPVKDISLMPNRFRGKDFTFEFDTPIPLNAINLNIQVIYQGYVGEDQAVVVATKDISEPSFLSVMNLFDHLLIEDTFYSFEEIENTDSLLQTLLQNGWSTPIYSNDIINFQLVVAPHKKTIATITEQMIPGDYFRLGLLLEPENTACTFHVDIKISDLDMYFSASMNNMLIPQHYQVDTYPAFGASEVRGSYHTSLKPFTFNGINIRPANEWDYSKMALPLSGKYTPVPVTVYF